MYNKTILPYHKIAMLISFIAIILKTLTHNINLNYYVILHLISSTNLVS